MADENTPETTTVTLEQIKELIGGLKTELIQEIDTRTNKAVTGMGTKLAKSLETKQSESIGSLIEEQLTKVINQVTAKEKPQGSGDNDTNSPQDPPAGDDPAGKLQAMIEQQNQQFEKRLSETQKQYEDRIKAMQDAVDEERLNTAKSNARNAALDPIRDRLHNPELAWAYLESQGVAYDTDKGYGVAGQDEFQNPTFTPLSDRLSNLEKEAAYLFKPRPGNGTGTQPSQGSQGGTPSNSSYAADSKVQPQDRFDAVRGSADPIADIVAKATAS